MSTSLFASAALLSCLAILGCSSGESTQGTGGSGGSAPSGPAAWNRPVTPPPDDEAAMKRLSCAYAPGSLPAETQGASHPDGSKIPIDHILVLMQENRSFDHYYLKLPEKGQPDVEVAPPTYTNPDTN